MLKFRVTNSMKARRAAEAQRKALEEKLQLEWAWKPMAAVMNESQTDLIYWIPPLYRNNVKTAGSRVRRKSLAHRSSLHRTSLSSVRLPYSHLQAAHMYSQLAASQRKKKLSSRRAKLTTEVSFEDPTDADSGVLDSRSEWQDTKDEDTESGIHDETADANVDDMSLLNVQSIQEEEVLPVSMPGTMKRRLGQHRRAGRSSIPRNSIPRGSIPRGSISRDSTPRNSLTRTALPRDPTPRNSLTRTALPRDPTPRNSMNRNSVTRTSIKPAVPPKPQFISTKPEYVTPKPDFITRTFEAIDKPKPAPTLIRLLEKVSHIHSPPVKAIKPTKPELKKIHRKDSGSKSSSNKKVKRPSVKIYRNPVTRLSGKKAKTPYDEEEGLENQCVVVSVDHHTQHKPPKEVPPKIPQELPKEEPKEIPCKGDDAEARNAHLQMILRLLAQLYEERVTRQDVEIQNLKMRIQTQDKLMKQMAHVVLELKEEITKIKLQNCAVPPNLPHPSHADVPANVLNIKVGQN